MKKKVTYDEAVSFTKFRLDGLERQFKETSDRFIWQTQQGGGINNIHMLDTIRALQFLYLEIAAHRDALRSLKVEI
jgi:hypothetical protein